MNEEAERINLIMNEPIENLLVNLEHLSRPISTRAGGRIQKMSQNLNIRSRGNGQMKTGMPKKSRAMTAAHNRGKRN